MAVQCDTAQDRNDILTYGEKVACGGGGAESHWIKVNDFC